MFGVFSVPDCLIKELIGNLLPNFADVFCLVLCTKEDKVYGLAFQSLGSFSMKETKKKKLTVFHITKV